MKKMTLVNESVHDFEVNGVKAGATVRVYWDYDEYTNPGDDFDFGDAEENASYLRRFTCGELAIVVVRVEAYFEGICGSDSLGAVHVQTKDIDADVLSTVADHSMIENALSELAREIQVMAETLKPFVA